MADESLSSLSFSSLCKNALFFHRKRILFMVFISLSVAFSNGNQKRYSFASKTPYFYKESKEFKSVLPSHCKAIHINLLARHGTRHPSKKDVKKINTMVKLVNDLYESGYTIKFDKVKFPWVSPFTGQNDKRLTERGEQELYNMSKRIRSRYSELFKSPLSTEHIKIVSTKTSRAFKSAMSFAVGILEGEGSLGACKMRPVEIESKNLDDDPILRFFDLCPKYKKSVSENKSSLYEHNDFKERHPMRKVVERIREQFGNSSLLKAKHVIGMFIACTFENAIFDRDDTWCSVFRQEDLEVLEYYYDLKHFWKRGYGYEINHNMACNLLGAILDDINNALNVSNIERKKGVFRFAHAETIQPLYCLLGLFKDNEKLRADNYQGKSQRMYQTSKIAPFGGNVALVLHNCSESKSETDEASFQVQTLVNEHPVSIPCCGDKTCSLKRFLSCFEDIAKNCDMKAVCLVKERQGHHDEL